jgi:hypothetical protein
VGSEKIFKLKKMKAILLASTLVLCSFCSGFAQAADSIKISLDRAKMLTELTQLRDSMNLSILSLDSKVKKGTSLNREKAAKSRKELLMYRDLVKLDIEEAESTAPNSWTEAAMERMTANMIATRREYKRLQTIL